MEGLEAGVSAVDSVLTDLLSEFNELEQDEVSDARNLAVAEEVLVTKVVAEGLQVLNELSSSERPVVLFEDGMEGISELFVGNELESVVVRTILRGLSEYLRAELSSDILMDSQGLSNLKVVTDDIWHVGEVQAEGVLLVLPLVLSDNIGLLLVLDLAVVEQVAGRVASAHTADVPVSESDLFLLRGLLDRVSRGR